MSKKCLLLLGLFFACLVQAAPSTEPALQEITDTPGLPRVLLIGDSVSIGYTPAVREQLKGKANVHRPASNCGSTKIGLRDLDKWLGDTKWDVIHFNFGLHDLGYRWTEDTNQNAQGVYATKENGGHPNVEVGVYESNLKELVGRLKKTGAKLIFATTTPVSADLHSYMKGSEAPYNAAAQRVMAQEGVAIDDLWAFAMPQIDQLQIPGNPHFTAKGSKVLGAQIAKSIEEALAKNAKP
jgi:lysophospholipase L1-like esterase